jgi:hypothetical protein
VQPNQQQGQENEMFNDMLRGYAAMLLAAGRDRGSVGKLLQILRGFVVWADDVVPEHDREGPDRRARRGQADGAHCQ